MAATREEKIGRWGENLLPLLIPIRDLKADPENARIHSERNLKAIRDSLTAFGQVKPIVYWYAPQPDGRDNVQTVLAGNGTFASASALGWTHIAAVLFKGTQAEADAFALADNRTAELAAWDAHRVETKIESIGANWDASSGVEWSPSLVGFDVPAQTAEYSPPAAPPSPAAPKPRPEPPAAAPARPQRIESFPLLIHCRTRDERAGIAAELERHGLRCTVEGA